MFGMRLLPWEYAVRNLFRRPLRSALTLAGLTLTVLLVFVVVGFVRGLEASLSVSGDAQVMLVHAVGADENVENSSIKGSSGGVLAASLPGVHRRVGAGGVPVPYVSPELFLGTQVSVEAAKGGTLGLVRGVTPSALLVRRSVQIIEGRWPGPGEALAGRLAAVKLGRSADHVAVGKTVTLEGRTWRISGRFASAGSALEAEFWCPLEDLQQAMKRQDLTLVAVTLAAGASAGDVDEFCKIRRDLELQATPETAFYKALDKHYRPVRALAWLVVFLVGGAGIFAGLNAMYGAVVSRVRELATLQALGYSRIAVGVALIQEAVLVAATAALIAAAIALMWIHGAAVRFTMGAFALQVDSLTVLIACGTGLFVGIVGAIPPAVRAMRLPVAEGLKAV